MAEEKREFAYIQFYKDGPKYYLTEHEDGALWLVNEKDSFTIPTGNGIISKTFLCNFRNGTLSENIPYSNIKGISYPYATETNQGTQGTATWKMITPFQYATTANPEQVNVTVTIAYSNTGTPQTVNVGGLLAHVYFKREG